jgi:orotidine-5'-phosphate decarboxylase
MPTAADRLIVALDTADLAEAVRLVKRLQGRIRYVKIGSILFTAEGPSAIRRLRALGCEVFLDLKFYDIPSTVERSCRAAVRYQVAMLTVHADGGSQMMAAAAQGVRREARRLGIRRPRVVGVTVLTSVGRSSTTHGRVVRLAREAVRAGLDGVVASAHEARLIRRALGASSVIVCPGIRPAGSDEGDQRRIATPGQAILHGADFLVVGRPITKAADPRAAATRILDEMRMAQDRRTARC